MFSFGLPVLLHNHSDGFLNIQPLIFEDLKSQIVNIKPKMCVFRHCLSVFNSDNTKQVNILLKTSISHADINLITFHIH